MKIFLRVFVVVFLLVIMPFSVVDSQDQPTWEICDVSPDGERILALKVFFLAGNLFILDRDGVVLERLTTDTVSHCGAWSPDGTQIAYSTNQGGKDTLHIMTLDTGETKQYPSYEVGLPGLDWSPDGNQIVFQLRRQGLAIFDIQNEEISLIDIDGSFPSWSPNGLYIAFVVNENTSRDLFIVDTNGNNLQRLTTEGGTSPTWSSDSSQIAFVSSRDASEEIRGSSDLYTLDIVTLEINRITSDQASKSSPHWIHNENVLLFQAWSQGSQSIYEVNVNTLESGIVFESIDENQPNPSSDNLEEYRSLLAFGKDLILYSAGSGDSASDIYVIDPSTGNSWRLTDGNTSEGGATWSPDGNKILFSKGIAGGPGPSEFDIFLMDADGTNERRVTLIEPEQAETVEEQFIQDMFLTGFDIAGSPSMSPDGTQIVFSVSDAFFENTDIFVMNADGSEIRPLTDASYLNYSPVWSPRGNAIAFVSDRTGSNEIYLMNTDGSNVRQLTATSQQSMGAPAWSPDGSEIAFYSGSYGKQEIYVMNADGSNVRRLTNNDHTDLSPSWSPDGSRIAFVASINLNSELYFMNSDGSEIRQLTDNFMGESGPVWRPLNIADIQVIDQQDNDLVTCEVVTTSGVNLREGPGTNYARIGSREANQTLLADGQVNGTDGFIWWRLADEGWIRSDLVNESDNCDDLPSVEYP